MLAIDEIAMWADPHSGGVPIVTHVHRAEVLSSSDKHPDAWFMAAGDHSRTSDTELHIPKMTIFVILRQNDHFETFALLFHQLF